MCLKVIEYLNLVRFLPNPRRGIFFTYTSNLSVVTFLTWHKIAVAGEGTTRSRTGVLPKI